VPPPANQLAPPLNEPTLRGCVTLDDDANIGADSVIVN